MSPSAVALIALAGLVGYIQAEIITPDHHVAMQKACSDLPDLSAWFDGDDSWKKLSDETQALLVKRMDDVCKIYNKHYHGIGSSDVETRDVLGGLSSLLGENSKLGTLLKAAEALNKAKGVLEEVKKIKPELHKHVQGGIQDIHDSLQELVDSITNEFRDKTAADKSSQTY